MSYTKGQHADAVRRAHNILEEWVKATGVVTIGSGYWYELQSIVEDAVHCGAQSALGIRKPLDSEEKGGAS